MKPVQVSEREVMAVDQPIAVRVFSGEGSARGTVFIHGATATPQSYYAHFATDLATRGYHVVTYDYRGVGRSRPASLAGFEATMSDWAKRDARAVLAFARAELPRPFFAVGHSFGAQLFGLLDEAHDVARAIFVGAQLGYMGHWPLPSQPRLALFWYGLVPTLTATLGYLPAWGGLGEELPAGVAREWGRWCRSPGYYLDHEPSAAARLAAFDRPVVAFSFGDDEFAPSSGTEAFLAQLSGARVTHRHHTPEELGVRRIGHFGFFRERFASTLWEEAARALTGSPLEGPARSLREPHLAMALESL
jgi:predicted alpha/beta hydrolase